jgi:hypothetical protein
VCIPVEITDEDESDPVIEFSVEGYARAATVDVGVDVRRGQGGTAGGFPSLAAPLLIGIRV